MTKSQRFVAFVIFPFLFLSLVIFTLFTSEISNSHSRREGHNVNPTGHLTVDTEFGTINIEATDEERIDITTTKKWKSKLLIIRPKHVGRIDELFEDLKVTTEYDNPDTQSNIRVEGKFNRGREYWQNGLKWFKVEIQVTVPRQYNVTLKTTYKGDIHVDDLAGVVRAEALDGSLHLGEIQGEVWGKAGVSGDITLKGGQSGVDLTAAMGGIRTEMATQPRHPWILHTSGSGNIDVTLRSDIAVNIDVQTQGKISSDFPIQWQDVIGENRLEGTLNGGGPLLKLRSPAGEIWLKRK